MTDEPGTTADEPVAARPARSADEPVVARPARREPSGKFALALVGAFLAGSCLTGCVGAALVAAAHSVRHERMEDGWHRDRDRWHERPEWYDRDRHFPPAPPAPVPPVVPPRPPAVPPAPPAVPAPSPSRT
ncbi:hypothetical protein [Catellatospora citrea]|uniref:Uncharacterized protein n=1 Tax=Catellatospora citrea TaxID=53366 RepID=A0A8J3P1V3_9ACTN|nr:hypothetical protein [Catellatospora citrea]RKE06203.1 hypothetical protein C8E86_1022 [Catellatospora citrea]GIG00542.1 hypothetical protein Cci01nite_56350 [Catellatospora citrea]